MSKVKYVHSRDDHYYFIQRQDLPEIQAAGSTNMDSPEDGQPCAVTAQRIMRMMENDRMLEQGEL